MEVKLMRTDDRLIHGQVMVRWVNHLKIKNIVIFDDEIADDSMLTNIFELACPSGVELIIAKVNDGEKVKEKIEGQEESTLILNRSPLIMEKVINNGFVSDLGYNIGPMSNKPKTTKLASFCYLLDDEIQALRNIHQKGINVFVQTVPDAEKLEWNDIEKII
ncbi:PTS system mannose/fructose/N-acetylgalactosamine-transporter subunit IIB [Maledivibacter halophilus]|uniref:PTS system, mannose-specific IIB component n=1 Tax=Maledivibacter halophilus TaxID=36842 RepID=A0A1T5M4A8_9FIRM|nr:PTS sugar transporter subunit IIB [Maledivibacter halophilus]SKC83087.1 PTS system, mannose-specific IIB component [Maledivibacter halophilus]